MDKIIKVSVEISDIQKDVLLYENTIKQIEKEIEGLEEELRILKIQLKSKKLLENDKKQFLKKLLDNY